jgi:uncharacterized membrane protein
MCVICCTQINYPTARFEQNDARFIFTRWDPHLCAPTLSFSQSLAYIKRNNNDINAARRFLLTRGLWLIVVEFTFVNFGLWFDVQFDTFLFDVIAAIGFGFIILGLLIKASRRTIAIVGLAIIFLHNMAPFVPRSESSLFKEILMPFFSPIVYSLGVELFVIGTPIPWLGNAGRIWQWNII